MVAKNLLALAIAAVRAQATLGEISAALEAAWGRHRAETVVRPGIYGAHLDSAALETVRSRVAAFAQNAGRCPRILIAKLGQDGHDRGQNVVASAFLDFGFDVIAGALFAAPEEVALQAAENNVDVVGISSLAAGHLTMLPALKTALARLDRAGVLLVAGRHHTAAGLRQLDWPNPGSRRFSRRRFSTAGRADAVGYA